MRGLLFILLTLGLCGQAFAQACCSASGNQDFAIVGPCRTAAITLQMRTNYALGSFDADGAYQSLREATVVDQILGIGFAGRLFSDRFQLGGQLPLHVQSRRLPGLPTHTAVGVGDVAVSGRYTLLDHPMSAPVGALSKYVDLMVIMTLPTGTDVANADAGQLGADVTSEGVYAGAFGARLSLVFGSIDTLNIAAGYEVRHAHDSEVSLGNGLFSSVEYARILNERWSIGAGAQYRRVFDGQRDTSGNVRIGRQRIRFSAAAVYGVSIPFWEVLFNAQFDPLFDEASVNLPYAGWSATVGLRRSFL